MQDKALQVVIPDGSTGVLSNRAHGIGIAEVSANRPQTYIYLTPDRLTDFSAGPADVYGQITFETK